MPIEHDVVRILGEVRGRLTPDVDDQPSPATPPHLESYGAERLLQDLAEDAGALRDYLESPDFTTIAAQALLTSRADGTIGDQLHHGLRLAGIPTHLLARTKTVVLMALRDSDTPSILRYGDTEPISMRDHVNSATANSRMLSELRSLTEIHAFAARMRTQVREMHAEMRLPHLGDTRTVPYRQLYVEPHLEHTVPLKIGAPGSRTVVLGDPGAGKSTLAEKLTYDIATEDSCRVPFLLVLREFDQLLGASGTDLPALMEQLCASPYHLTPPPAALQYLLRNGRAVVVLDGLDELVHTELRRRVVKVVQGFAHAYPLVPIVVTAREIGYKEAPLNEKLFPVTYVKEFDDDQVLRYVQNWFALDRSAKPAVRELLPGSFMKQSTDIAELRSNPLLLALLCTLFSSERYLPQELAKVYEKCALLLFEQWDKSREIPLPMKFRGHLREAVEHLAWHMFTGSKSGEPLEESRILRVLGAYLEPRLGNSAEAMSLAQDFLAFCTGRAWVLNDVGSTTVERKFGFTHRTFLEYFSARHLVRNNKDAERLWAVMGPHVELGEWEVVGQIALQLYHDGTANGIDELLMTALENDGLAFAARALGYVQPSRPTIRAVACAAVQRSLAYPIEYRETRSLQAAVHADDAMVNAVRCSPDNRADVEQAVGDELMRHQTEITELARHHLRDDLPGLEAMDLQGKAWAAPHLLDEDLVGLRELVTSFGPAVLFRPHQFHSTLCLAAASVLTLQDVGAQAARNALAELLTRAQVPWTLPGFMPVYPFYTPSERLNGHDALTALLCLPSLEHCADHGFAHDTSMMEVQADLVWARYCGRADLGLVRQLPRLVRPFLTAWILRRFSVSAPDPLRPRRRRVPR